MLTRSSLPVSLLGTALLFTATSASADPQPSACAVSIAPGGELVSLSGTASATDTCGGSRGVACGHSLFGGEGVSTGANSTAGVMVGDILIVLGPNSEARIGLTPDGTADVVLERGSVRMIDPRESGEPAALRAGESRAYFVGNDVQAKLGQGEPTLCGWEAPLVVARIGTTTTSSQSCSDAQFGGASLGLAAGAGVGGAATCEPRLSIAALVDLTPLPPVAGGPPGLGPPPPTLDGGPPRSPCDNPGSGCGTFSTGPPGITVVEQPPGDLPFPGGGGTFPGGGGTFPGPDPQP